LTIISAQFKILAKFDFAKSKVELHVLHAKGWRPLFELTAQDIIKLFNKVKKRKIK
jgi:hypothetical protein